MANYTVNQAQTIVSSESDDDVLARYIDSLTTGENPLSAQELLQLRDAGYISNAEVTNYPAAIRTVQQSQQKNPPSGASNLEGLYPYDPATGQYSNYPAESPVGTTAVEGQGGINTYADPQSGLLYNDRGTLLPKYLQTGAGGPGADHYATDSAAHNAAAQLAYEYATLEEKKAEFGLTFPEQQREFDLQHQLAQQQAQQGYLQSRASTGLQLGDLVRGLSNDAYQRALDPGNYPAYLAASAGLPQGTGSPISALIGQGTQIQAPAGSNPLADPRFANLLSNEYDYAQPGALQTVQNLVQPNGQLPQAFYDYTHTQNPNIPAHAHGGSQMLNGPVVGIPQGQLMPGQTPQFLAGEAGQEKLTFSPMHTHETNGMPVPHQHEGAHAAHEHLGSMIRYEDGGTAITGTQPTIHQLNASWNAYHPNDQKADNIFTPAEGTAISLGKALQPLGYVPSYLTGQLLEGRTPTPGSIDESTLSRLPPSLRALLQAQIRSALGGAGVQDYNFQLQQNALPGLNSGTTSTVYSG